MSRLREQLGVRSRIEKTSRSLLRFAWDCGVEHQNPDATYMGAPLRSPLLVVLGMHRSGTSAVSGMLEDQGFSTGLAAEPGKADNPLGTRENPDLVRLDNEVLELNRCSWDRPPSNFEIRFTGRYLRRRDKLVARLTGQPAVLKDPRMVLLQGFWEGVPFVPIGVIRDPLAVSDSLRRREPQRSVEGCFDLWHVYNAHLLRWLETAPFPVIQFGGDQDMAREVAGVLFYYGLDTSDSFRFFDRSLIRATERGGRWRQHVPRDLTVIWDEIDAVRKRIR